MLLRRKLFLLAQAPNPFLWVSLPKALQEFLYFLSILIFSVWTNISEMHSHGVYMLVAYLWTGHEFGVKTQLKCVSMGLCLRIIKAHHSPAAYEGENSDKKGSSAIR